MWGMSKKVAGVVALAFAIPVSVCSCLGETGEANDERSTVSKAPRGDSPRVMVNVLRTDPLSGLHDGKRTSSSLIEVVLEPMAASMPHRHPGPVVGYVLEGTLEFQIGDQPLRVLRPGDTFFEPKMILHRVARNPDDNRKCRFLVTMVHPTDAKQLVIPEGSMNP